MTDVDINSFGEHDKTDSHPDETGDTVPCTPGGQWEAPLGKQTENKKHHLEERVKVLDLWK